LPPPSWLPVTLEPTNDIVESPEIEYVRAEAIDSTASTASDTLASSVLSAGFAQPETKSDNVARKIVESEVDNFMPDTNYTPEKRVNGNRPTKWTKYLSNFYLGDRTRKRFEDRLVATRNPLLGLPAKMQTSLLKERQKSPPANRRDPCVLSLPTPSPWPPKHRHLQHSLSLVTISFQCIISAVWLPALD